jgi:hypothetical protein
MDFQLHILLISVSEDQRAFSSFLVLHMSSLLKIRDGLQVDGGE